MIYPISDEEVKKALFVIGEDKSLGPNGFFTGFFKKVWNAMLVNLNFPNLMIKWIMECVSTTFYSISSNGRYHGFFKGRKVLRLYDPLSPLLFVICLEYLSRMLRMLENNAYFKYHPKCEALKISHLAFADDLILFSRGDYKSVQILMGCVNNFSACSGLLANPLKSNLYHAGVKEDVLEGILQITGFNIRDFPFQYLGVPLAASRLNSSQYSPLINKIANLFKSWPKNTLSYAGKLEIINSIIQGIECLWLAIFPIPNNVLEHIVKLCRAFFWGGRRKPLVAWKEVCIPKDEGGLGVFDLKAWNMTLLSKTLWNVQAKKDSLWSR
ncbi:uncharacterized protein LOC131151289 [Malania oleifera]|uniref:uncharacterized protein LOC131151289 n=1 Tax=Malania oleifera TaxID=397392 RepID=UPI0025AE46A6|nr:uncharacterized protein LOC131151289 [Malania oleifera]